MWTESKIKAGHWPPNPPAGVAQPQRDKLKQERRNTRVLTRQRDRILDQSKQQGRENKNLKMQLKEEKEKYEDLYTKYDQALKVIEDLSLTTTLPTSTSTSQQGGPTLPTLTSTTQQGRLATTTSTGRAKTSAQQAKPRAQRAQAARKPKPQQSLEEIALATASSFLGPALALLFRQTPKAILFILQMKTDEFDTAALFWMAYCKYGNEDILATMEQVVQAPEHEIIVCSIWMALRRSRFFLHFYKLTGFQVLLSNKVPLL